MRAQRPDLALGLGGALRMLGCDILGDPHRRLQSRLLRRQRVGDSRLLRQRGLGRRELVSDCGKVRLARAQLGVSARQRGLEHRLLRVGYRHRRLQR